MEKKETKQIKEFVLHLGSKLGFIVEDESCPIPNSNNYSPVCDVAWYLDLTKYFNVDSLSPLFIYDVNWLNLIKRLPFAGFEIEGSMTSSKNQISNFANLYYNQFIFKIAITNNAGAGRENDTYRRGLKICRYFNDMLGHSNFLFADWQHIKKTNYDLKEITIKVANEREQERSGVGGEIASVPVFNKIIPFIQKSCFKIKQNYSPEKFKWDYFLNDEMYKLISTINVECEFYFKKKGIMAPESCELRNFNKISDSYYIPKLDIVAGFKVPEAFLTWLRNLSFEIGNDVVNYPLLYAIKHNYCKEIFLPVISFEIETSISKHLNGGIINMSKNSFCGILVAKKESITHLNTYKKYLSCNNILFYQY